MTCVRATLTVTLLGAAALLAAGCSADPRAGYTWDSPYSDDVRSVAVPIWTRGVEVYRRDVEFRLTEALKKRIELDTPWKVMPRSRADTELTGVIESIGQQVLSVNPDTGRPMEQRVEAVLSFKWVDLHTGEVLRERSNVIVTSTYLREAPYNEDFFLGYEDLVNQAARRIVEELEQDW